MKVKVTSNHHYSPRFKGGDIVEIDQIKRSGAYGGFSVRVVGVWSKPKWFSIMWFVDDYEKVNQAVIDAVIELLERQAE